MRAPLPNSPATLPQTHAPLWLAASNGRRLARPTRAAIPPADAPEAPMTIEFFGISEDEQRAALAGFPGGRRFILRRR